MNQWTPIGIVKALLVLGLGIIGLIALCIALSFAWDAAKQSRTEPARAGGKSYEKYLEPEVATPRRQNVYDGSPAAKAKREAILRERIDAIPATMSDEEVARLEKKSRERGESSPGAGSAR